MLKSVYVHSDLDLGTGWLFDLDTVGWASDLDTVLEKLDLEYLYRKVVAVH